MYVLGLQVGDNWNNHLNVVSFIERNLLPEPDMEKTNSMNSVEFNFFYFSPNLLFFLPNLDFWTCKLKNNFKNFTFIAWKWCKICKYYVNSMVISNSTCQREENECICVQYLIYAVLSRFQICPNFLVFSANSVFPKFQSSQQNGFFQVCDLN